QIEDLGASSTNTVFGITSGGTATNLLKVDGQGNLTLSGNLTINGSSLTLPAGSVTDSMIAAGTITQDKISDTNKAVYTFTPVSATTANCENGSTVNSDAAITACVAKASANGGGTVFLKAGTYTISASVTPVSQGVTIMGAGDDTILSSNNIIVFS